MATGDVLCRTCGQWGHNCGTTAAWISPPLNPEPYFTPYTTIPAQQKAASQINYKVLADMVADHIADKLVVKE